jgi:8-oxo-dGTP pyrophosphatase MutT (NUDIX family)
MPMPQKTPQVFGTILVSPDKKILLVKGRRTGKWSFPKGHPEENEEEIPCARRETYEETGIRVSPSYDDVVTLATGRYYIYHMNEKPTPTPEDATEVERADWWSIHEMRNMLVNVDINYFLRNYVNLIL